MDQGPCVDWRAKVDLFEQLRREHEFGIGTIAGVAAKFGVHRRMVRQALAGALPPHRYPPRAKPKLGVVADFMDKVLDEDRLAPRKQRHTARRLYRRILTEFPDATVAEPTVRNHIRAQAADGAGPAGDFRAAKLRLGAGSAGRLVRPGSTSARTAARFRCLPCARWPAGRRSTAPIGTRRSRRSWKRTNMPLPRAFSS